MTNEEKALRERLERSVALATGLVERAGRHGSSVGPFICATVELRVDDMRAAFALFDALDAARAEANGYAQQAGALRRELDEARAKFAAMDDESVQFAMQRAGVIAAERDLANAMHVEASRQRDECAAEAVRLREALAASLVVLRGVREHTPGWGKATRGFIEQVNSLLSAPSSATEALTERDAKVRATVLGAARDAVTQAVTDVCERETKAISKGSAPYGDMFRRVVLLNDVHAALDALATAPSAASGKCATCDDVPPGEVWSRESQAFEPCPTCAASVRETT